MLQSAVAETSRLHTTPKPWWALNVDRESCSCNSEQLTNTCMCHGMALWLAINCAPRYACDYALGWLFLNVIFSLVWTVDNHSS